MVLNILLFKFYEIKFDLQISKNFNVNFMKISLHEILLKKFLFIGMIWKYLIFEPYPK